MPSLTLSVVIPTWNEERWLPRLLQAIEPCEEIAEIVIADNASNDRTREIAKSFGCRVVDGGRPAEGRNRGAAATEGDRLLFMDADVFPSRAALRLATSPTDADAIYFKVIPIAAPAFVRGCYATADAWFAALAVAGIHRGLTNFLVVTRSAFERVGGFDEHLDPGEDVDFVRRLGRVANVEYERMRPILISARRFSSEPAVTFAAKTVFWEALRLAGVRRNVLRYRWLEHDARIAVREEAWLTRTRHTHG